MSGLLIPCFAQQPAAKPKPRPKPAGKKSPRRAKPVAAKSQPKPVAAPAAPKLPDILTNESVIQMVRSGMDEPAILAAIEARPARFQLDADHLTELDQEKVPSSVRRAMLNKSAPPPEPAAAAAPAPAPAAAPPPVPAGLDHALARQDSATFPLTDHPQSVLFVKSESGDAKEAIANLLLSDAGLSLITMGLAPQMKMWNPYFGDTLSKVTAVGKGLLRSRGTTTKGFEYDTLGGTTAGVTLHEGKPELLIPMEKYLASADTDLTELQPVLLKLETRDQDQRRLLTARRVLLKQNKKGRFDLKPTVDREELGIEQNALPVEAELLAGHVYRITPKEDLRPGEYALVFRRKAGSGSFTANVPLKPTPAPAEQPDPVEAQMMAAGMMAPPPQARGGLFGRSKPAPPAAQAQQGPLAGFLAWDFRVLSGK